MSSTTILKNGIIQLINLTKQFGNIKAVDNLSLEIQNGEIIGLLGPNGAGKSTLMRMISRIMKPTTGAILWNGTDALKKTKNLLSVLGYLPQDFGVYPNLNANEFLEYMAALKGVSRKAAKKRINELLNILNLYDVRNRPLKSYSGGMKQRIGIAQALLNDPEILIVDEPTVGLDPEERVRFRNLISDIAGNRIIILSTHIVSDVEASATKIAIMNKGKLITFKKPEELLQEMEGKVWNTVISSAKLTQWKQKYLISRTMRQSQGIQLRVIQREPPTSDSTQVTPTLEDAYLYYIKNHHTEDA